MEGDSLEQESNLHERQCCTEILDLSNYDLLTEDQIIPSLYNLENVQHHSIILDIDIPVSTGFDNFDISQNCLAGEQEAQILLGDAFIPDDECSMTEVPDAVLHEQVMTDEQSDNINDGDQNVNTLQSDTNNNDMLEIDTDKTNTELIRKRKQKGERQDLIKNRKIEKHPLRPPCADSCIKKCTMKFSQICRQAIHKKFWSLTWLEQRLFILNTCARKQVDKKSENSSRNLSFIYTFSQEGKDEVVCKTFF